MNIHDGGAKSFEMLEESGECTTIGERTKLRTATCKLGAANGVPGNGGDERLKKENRRGPRPGSSKKGAERGSMSLPTAILRGKPEKILAGENQK